MIRVRYPFHVKHDGRDYAPNEPIEVKDAAEHLLRGASVVEEDEPAKSPAKKRRTAKSDE